LFRVGGRFLFAGKACSGAEAEQCLPASIVQGWGLNRANVTRPAFANQGRPGWVG
jgi:hypothetical protein